MNIIIDKRSHAVLFQVNVDAGRELKPEELFPGFDPKTMVFGRAPLPYVPARFEIRDGVVVDLDAPPLPAEPVPETLAQARERKKQLLTGDALAQRSKLVPDYQLLNIGLGVYDETRVAGIKATVNAFRDEVNRVEAQIDKARTIKEVDALQPSFPVALVRTGAVSGTGLPKAAARTKK
ncbi:hypothetical protein LRH25_31485 [Ideonella azotifigens]|uniref:Uncharacterized protein n=1 Tax=Ideonella azotifigens TaxID=513160 RepID=A0ABN1K048_9BURK|nr:hypothetical protein [Ideonella azotifigens]MCD2344848.1 hypothetical protein [Ideonella azotifigens]